MKTWATWPRLSSSPCHKKTRNPSSARVEVEVRFPWQFSTSTPHNAAKDAISVLLPIQEDGVRRLLPNQRAVATRDDPPGSPGAPFLSPMENPAPILRHQYSQSDDCSPPANTGSTHFCPLALSAGPHEFIEITTTVMSQKACKNKMTQHEAQWEIQCETLPLSLPPEKSCSRRHHCEP